MKTLYARVFFNTQALQIKAPTLVPFLRTARRRLARVSPAQGISQPRPFCRGGSAFNRKRPQRPPGSRGPRRGRGARAEGFPRGPAGVAALPELRPAGLPSPSPPLPPLLSSLSHENAPRERGIAHTQSTKSHFKLKGKTELPSRLAQTSPYLFMFPQALISNLHK